MQSMNNKSKMIINIIYMTWKTFKIKQMFEDKE